MLAVFVLLAVSALVSPATAPDAGAPDSTQTAVTDSNAVLAYMIPRGAIAGRVRFEGNPPPPGTRDVRVDTAMCGTDPKPDRSLRVDPATHGVRDAVVTLEPRGSNHAATAHPSPAPPAIIDEASCEYFPFVTLVRPGGTVMVTNSDPGLHDIHRLSQGGVAGSHDASPPGSRVPLTFLREGRFEFACDLHHWSSAWVVVTQAPYSFVTEAGGTFSFRNLAPGPYTLRVWQHRLGEWTRDVEIPVGETLTLDVAMPLPFPTPPGAPAPPGATPGPTPSATPSPARSPSKR